MNKFRKPHGNGERSRGAGDRGGNRPSFNRPGQQRFGGGNSREGSGQMFDAVCAECGKPCQVPFRPNGTRPVYCSVCFGKQKSEGGSSRGQENFRPMPDRRNSFADRQAAPVPVQKVDDRNIIELRRQVDTLSSKIDIMLRMMQDAARPAVTSAEAPISAPGLIKADSKKTSSKNSPVKKPLKKKGPSKR